MIDVRKIGSHLGRARHENGWVELTGRQVKKWLGQFHVYVTLPDGSERRLRRKVTLGERATMSKGEAQDKLREYIICAL